VRRPIAAAAATALALAALAGCGEKDEPETTGPVVTTETGSTSSTTTGTTTTTTQPDTPPQTAADAVEAFLVSSDAELVCDEVITPKFLRASYGDRTGCIAARKPATLATSAGIAPGGNAVITAEPKGGIYDGEKLTFTTVSAAGGFAIDSVKSNVPVGP
jgi:hypothetical protein